MSRRGGRGGRGGSRSPSSRGGKRGSSRGGSRGKGGKGTPKRGGSSKKGSSKGSSSSSKKKKKQQKSKSSKKKKKQQSSLMKFLRKHIPCLQVKQEVNLEGMSLNAVKLLGFNEKDIIKIKVRFDDIDIDQTGEIDYNEFLLVFIEDY